MNDLKGTSMFSVYVLETVTWIKDSMHNYFHSGAGISKTEGCTLTPGVVTKDDSKSLSIRL